MYFEVQIFPVLSVHSLFFPSVSLQYDLSTIRLILTNFLSLEDSYL